MELNPEHTPKQTKEELDLEELDKLLSDYTSRLNEATEHIMGVIKDRVQKESKMKTLKSERKGGSPEENSGILE